MARKTQPDPHPRTVRLTARGEADAALLADAWDCTTAEAIRRAVQEAAARVRKSREREGR